LFHSRLRIHSFDCCRTEASQFRRLLKNAQRHKEQLPSTLFIAREDIADLMAREAAHQNIHVVRVPESELLVFIAEARQGFAERFEGVQPLAP
jgi:hypothetical protein